MKKRRKVTQNEKFAPTVETRRKRRGKKIYNFSCVSTTRRIFLFSKKKFSTCFLRQNKSRKNFYGLHLYYEPTRRNALPPMKKWINKLFIIITCLKVLKFCSHCAACIMQAFLFKFPKTTCQLLLKEFLFLILSVP